MNVSASYRTQFPYKLFNLLMTIIIRLVVALQLILKIDIVTFVLLKFQSLAEQ